MSARLQLAKQSLRRYTVSATDGSGKISTLAVKVHGGSRYATKDGVSHLLSRFNFQNTSGKSALRLVRESELLGGKFESTVDREYITLKATFLKEDLPYYVNALGNVLYKTSFKSHELKETVLPAANHDLAVAETCPVQKAEDLLYNITYRKGLGNTVLYDGVQKVTLEDIKEYADKVYTKENIEIVGQGVNEADLKKFVSDSLLNSLPTGSPLATSVASKTYTGEARARFSETDSVAAIAVPVTQEAFAQHEVLARFVTSPLFEFSSLVHSAKLQRFNGAGLFILYVKGPDSTQVSQNIKKVVAALRKGQDLSAAKEYATLKFAIENDGAVPAVQLDTKDVSSFKLDKFNYVAVGDVANLPYADEL